MASVEIRLRRIKETISGRVKSRETGANKPKSPKQRRKMERGNAQNVYKKNVVFMSSVLKPSTPSIRLSKMITSICKAIRNMCQRTSHTESAPCTSAHHKSEQFSEALAALPCQSALQRYAGQSQSSGPFSETLYATYHVKSKEDSAPDFHGIKSSNSGASCDRTRSMPQFEMRKASLETFSATYCSKHRAQRHSSNGSAYDSARVTSASLHTHTSNTYIRGSSTDTPVSSGSPQGKSQDPSQW